MKFSTERLILRTITENDTNDILNIRSNLEINRFLHRNPPKTLLESLDFILSIKQRTANQEIIFLGISYQNNPKLIGTICLWKFSDDRKKAEVGYELLPEYHRKGLMSEALNAVLNFGFNELNLQTILAFTNKLNENSKGLLLKHQFVLQEGRTDEGFPENVVFSLKKNS